MYVNCEIGASNIVIFGWGVGDFPTLLSVGEKIRKPFVANQF